MIGSVGSGAVSPMPDRFAPPAAEPDRTAGERAAGSDRAAGSERAAGSDRAATSERAAGSDRAAGRTVAEHVAAADPDEPIRHASTTLGTIVDTYL